MTGIHATTESMAGIVADAQSLVGLICGYRYLTGNEIDLQDGLARVFDLNEIPYLREYALGPEFGRVDFFLPDSRIGLELKVQGSPTAVLRQLYRYTLSPEIDSLIFVTARARLIPIDSILNGKPVFSAALWSGQF